VRPLSELDHYEILEISRKADLQEIERAYRMACSIYTDDSLAGYSILVEGDAEAIRERAEIAHRVLSDPEARRSYDASLGGESLPPVEAPQQVDLRPEFLPDVADLEELDDETGEFDGARLRRSRLRRGIEIEDVAGVTKINPTYLRFLEEDRFSELPARVYVRGFVTAYARCLGLDAKRVAGSYMKHYQSEPVGRRRTHS